MNKQIHNNVINGALYSDIQKVDGSNPSTPSAEKYIDIQKYSVPNKFS
jgi:hypothetical protein